MAQADLRKLSDDEVFDRLLSLKKKLASPEIDIMLRLQRIQTIRGIADFAEMSRSIEYRLDDIICMKFNVVTRKHVRKRKAK